MVIGFNGEIQKGQKYFDNLIKNEDASEVKHHQKYGETRTIYTLSEGKKSLLLYHYYILVERLYQYRKLKMEPFDNLIISSTFDIKGKKSFDNSYCKDVIILAENIDNVYSYGNYTGFFYNAKELLENFYRGNLGNGIYRVFDFSVRKFDGDAFGFRPYFPYKLMAFKKNDSQYYSEQVIRVPDCVRIIDYLVNGELRKYTNSSSASIDQLNCFEFDLEPYDEIGLNMLDDIYGTLNMKHKLLVRKENVIDYAIHQAKANEQILSLVRGKK